MAPKKDGKEKKAAPTLSPEEEARRKHTIVYAQSISEIKDDLAALCTALVRGRSAARGAARQVSAFAFPSLVRAG